MTPVKAQAGQAGVLASSEAGGVWSGTRQRGQARQGQGIRLAAATLYAQVVVINGVSRRPGKSSTSKP
jgi:hypothetical protein